MKITLHAILRAAERLDLVLTHEDEPVIADAIASGVFHFIGTRGPSGFYGAILHGRGCILCVRDDLLITVLNAGDALSTDVDERDHDRRRDAGSFSRRSHRIRRRKLEESFEEERS